jgi:hypothetical protein
MAKHTIKKKAKRAGLAALEAGARGIQKVGGDKALNYARKVVHNTRRDYGTFKENMSERKANASAKLSKYTAKARSMAKSGMKTANEYGRKLNDAKDKMVSDASKALGKRKRSANKAIKDMSDTKKYSGGGTRGVQLSNRFQYMNDRGVAGNPEAMGAKRTDLLNDTGPAKGEGKPVKPNKRPRVARSKSSPNLSQPPPAKKKDAKIAPAPAEKRKSAKIAPAPSKAGAKVAPIRQSAPVAPARQSAPVAPAPRVRMGLSGSGPVAAPGRINPQGVRGARPVSQGWRPTQSTYIPPPPKRYTSRRLQMRQERRRRKGVY